jgi:hypothetical protein
MALLSSESTRLIVESFVNKYGERQAPKMLAIAGFASETGEKITYNFVNEVRNGLGPRLHDRPQQKDQNPALEEEEAIETPAPAPLRLARPARENVPEEWVGYEHLLGDKIPDSFSTMNFAGSFFRVFSMSGRRKY